MKKIRVLLLGAAFSADLHMEGYVRNGETAEIVAIADRNTQAAKELAERYQLKDCRICGDFAEALEEVDCDLVDICLPNFLHRDAAVLALGKGRDVVCEKPLAVSCEAAREMVETAGKTGRHIYYAEDWIYAPAIRRAMEIVREGAIGKLLYLRARESHSGSHSPYVKNLDHCGGGVLLHMAIHPIGLAMALNENKWTQIMATTSGGGAENLLHKDMGGEDWAVASMRFENGAAAVVESNFVTYGGMEDYIDLYGTEGCLHIDLTFSSPIRCFSLPGVSYAVEKAETTVGWSRPAVDEKYNIGYVAEITHFLDCCRRGAEADPGMRGIDGLLALEAVEAAYRSAARGTVIHLEDMTRENAL